MGYSNNKSRQARIYNTAYNVGRSIKRYAPMIKRAYNSYKRYKSSPKSVKSSVVSFQHDFAKQYQRRPAPRRVKKQQRRAAKNFRFQLGKSLGQYSRVFNHVYAPATVTPTSFANSQTVFDIMLYGAIQNDTQGRADWLQFCGELGLFNRTGKVYCKSAVMDVQIRNVDEGSTLVIDAYRYVARREGYDSPGSEWAQALINQDQSPSSTTKMTTGQLNVTPFDAPGFGSKYLIKSKIRYRIAPGNSVYLQLRDPRNYEFDTARFDYDSGATSNRIRTFKGMTQGFLFVARSGSLDATNAYQGEVNWQVTHTQTYHVALHLDDIDNQGAN